MKSRRLLLALISTVGFVWADPVAIVNPGFEDITGETVQFEFTFSPPPGWNLYDPSAITAGGAGPDYYVGTLTPFVPDPINHPGVFVNFPGGAPEGQRVAIAFNDNPTGGGGEYGLVQTLSATLQADTAYSLRVLIGNIASGQSQNFGFFNLNGFPGYRVDLLAGGVVIASDNNSLLPDEGTFEESLVSYTTGSGHAQLGQALGIRLVNLNLVDNTDLTADWEVDFDDVRLTATAVPEPAATAIVLASGCLLLAWFRRRRTS
jgi:hypothetical protein